jgi:hypothetical protein
MRFIISIGLATAMFVGGCELGSPGVPPPPAELNFPVAVALAGQPRSADGGRPFLLVANSNFDLRYSSGTLQSYRLDVVDALIEDAIAAGRCAPESYWVCEISDEQLRTAMVSEVLTGSHMGGLALGSAGDRAYLPRRSRGGGLTWVEFDAVTGVLHCGPSIEQGREQCDALHESTNTMIAASRGLSLPSDPVALTVVPRATLGLGERGDFIVMAHRNGNASLFVDDHTDVVPSAPPHFVHTLSGVPNDIVSIEAAPDGLVWLTSAASSATRASRDLVALEIVPTSVAAELRVARRMVLRGIDDGLDTRDLALDERGERLWVLSRRPEAIVTVDFRVAPLASGEAPLGPIHSVGLGPSRLEVYRPPMGSTLVGELLLVTCYGARALFVVDPELGTVATVSGLNGPFEMAVDGSRQRVYVADFRFSVIWVVDMSPLLAGGSPLVRARLGTGHAPSVFR